ncbi:hypothetical protein GALMADRAFT_253758 [Galerina marginata CBS 339.88]|uniref:Uncharacterized protein n=1 Tax=Galerina marginata (strain CBS 339.88) TaxID=685588 RepID=A0A067SXK1_GALM3|nr:hypothetical protein GALMADRAFT_253758 [Galerina marginata CBS 339.88]
MSVTFACYLPAEQSVFITVKIPFDAWAAELLKAVALELKCVGHEVSRQDLRLFKTDVPLFPRETLQSRSLQWLHEQPEGSQMNDMKKLSFVFPHGPHKCDHLNLKLDIIVADAEVLEMVDGLGDPYDVYKRWVKKALNECLNNRLSLPSPSDLVKDPRRLKMVFGGEEPDIHVGRPGGAPAVIFSPVLAALQQSFDDLEKVDVSEGEAFLAANYIRCATKFYDREDLRQEAIKELVNAALGGADEWGISIDKAPVNDVAPDCYWWYDMFVILVLELKDSLGLSGDALSQAVLDYTRA